MKIFITESNRVRKDCLERFIKENNFKSKINFINKMPSELLKEDLGNEMVNKITKILE